MRKILSFVCVGLIFVVSLEARADHTDLLSRKTDPGFSGWYLDIQKTQERFKISRLEAHEIQNQMRDYLEDKASYSPFRQKPFLKEALDGAIKSVVGNGKHESGYRPIEFKKDEFIVVFDLDETLLTQWYERGKGQYNPWYKVGKKEGEQIPYRFFKSSGVPSIRARRADVVPSTVDRKTGNSKEPEMLVSPFFVQVRPGADELVARIAEMPGCRGIVLFTAKDDRAFWAMLKPWLAAMEEKYKDNPEKNPFRRGGPILGMFTRNYLVYPSPLGKPSKDLRMFDETLEHVVLIDDNESRVLQQDLNYRIPKFNADKYIETREKTGKTAKIAQILNNEMLKHVGDLIENCVRGVRSGKGKFSDCVKATMGSLSSQKDKVAGSLIDAHAELKQFVKAIAKKWGLPPVDQVVRFALETHVFHQDFERIHERKLKRKDRYPRFEKGVQKELLDPRS